MTKTNKLSVFPELETSRFRLRALHVSDAADLFAYFSDEEVTKFYDPHFTTLTAIAEAEALIAFTHTLFSEGRGYRWGVCDKTSGRVIGTIGYHSFVKEFHKAEVGYEVARDWWGKGAATEVLRAVLAFGFGELCLNRIEAFCDDENTGSWKVLQKAGFTHEGTMRDFCIMNGTYRNSRVYALLRKDYVPAD